MTEIDKDKELQRELKKIHWQKYLDYGIIEIRVRDGKCKMIEVRRSYTNNTLSDEEFENLQKRWSSRR